MRIALNLATAPSPRERYALAWAVPVTVAALAVLLLLALFTVRSYREYRKVHRSLLEVRAAEDALRNRQATLQRDLEQPHSREIFRRVRFVNGLIDEKQFSLTGLTKQVTGLLPPQVRLTGLGLVQGGSDPVVRFTIVGNSEEAAEKFLANLEDSPSFRDVFILNQGFGQGESAEGAVTIACTAHYQGWKSGGSRGQE